MQRVTRHTLIAYGLISLECLLTFICIFATLFAARGSFALALISGLALSGLLLISLQAMQLYSASQRETQFGVQLRVGLGVIAAATVVWLLYLFGMRIHGLGLWLLLKSAATAWLVIALLRILVPNPFHHDFFRHRVLILGHGQQALWLARAVRRRSDRARFDLIGFVSSSFDTHSKSKALSPEVTELDPLLQPQLGSAEQLVAVCQQHCIDEIVVALDDRRGQMPLQSLLRCRLQGIAVSEAVPFLERLTGKLHIDQVNPSGLIFTEGFTPYDRQERLAEWGLNFVLAGAILLLTSPLLLLLILAIWLEDGRDYGILYRQPRIGRGGRIFQIIKFRSMAPTSKPGTEEWAKVNDPRVTRVGKWMRKLHIDELPQLLNVLRGDMNIVGPRPEQPSFVAELQQQIPFYHERHLVKPGLTGWAQIRYPYGASKKDALEKLKYDLYYVKRRSLAFNLQIFIQTIEVVLFTRGAR